MKGILSGAVTSGNVNRIGEFYVTDSAQAANPPRDRGDREIDEIAPRELTLVIRKVREDRPSLKSDQLIREVANRFGFRRITEKLNIILAKLLDD